jgi:hypothetical protein
MVVVSSSDFQAETDRQLVNLLADMHRDADEAVTFHGKALRSIAYLRSQPRLMRFLLLDLVRDSPVASSANAAPDAGVKGRPAIGASKPESGSTLSTS